MDSKQNPLAGTNRIGTNPFLSGGFKLKSQVNGLDECLVPWAGRDSSCPALSGDHDTSVTKQRDATNWLLTAAASVQNICSQRLCTLCNSECGGIRYISLSAVQTMQNKGNSFLEAALNFRSSYPLLEVPLRSLA